MKLYITGKMFESVDTVTVTGEHGEAVYTLRRDSSKEGHVIAVNGTGGVKVAEIEQRGIGVGASFAVLVSGEETAVVEKTASIQPDFNVRGPGWFVDGSLFKTKYAVTKENNPVGELKVALLKSEIDIADDENPIFAVAAVMAIRNVLFNASIIGGMMSVAVSGVGD